MLCIEHGQEEKKSDDDIAATKLTPIQIVQNYYNKLCCNPEKDLLASRLGNWATSRIDIMLLQLPGADVVHKTSIKVAPRDPLNIRLQRLYKSVTSG
jgi:hypothetical protein